MMFRLKRKAQNIGGEKMGITLKAARINANLNQNEAAKLIGVTTETLSNWERGKSFPDVPKIMKIEETYKLSYSDIIFLPSNFDLTE